ncbi:AT-rich interactive domain-containing protein 3A [Acanthopagrus latus]|uniref:AT-rich interactive domain-containing protein 3A n=1 Tax=Acanthopagrus latus TaxID=8177 RepID=UPI00187CB29C|nr:AT-rich interactive domain-containing protein 3A [Acanthopagrus latus]
MVNVELSGTEKSDLGQSIPDIWSHPTERSMVDNRSGAPKSSLQGSSTRSLPLQASSLNAFPSTQSHPPGSGGMKLEVVMENLQRQQAARLALEEKVRQAETQKDLRSMVESHIHQQALAFRHYQEAMRGALNDEVANLSAGVMLPHIEVLRADDDSDSRPGGDCKERGEEENDIDEHEVINEQEKGEDDAGSIHNQRRQASLQGACLPPHSAPMHHMARVPGALGPTRRAESPSAHHQSHQHHEWTYEEQFRQLYELDGDEKRKQFLDDLFSFMQKRGTPVNRIPIMAKQVLDLYMLYKLVTEKGGLVEVINKKIWREITKGLNLPTSITSAAFTLRTQYMKYLYPYECERQGFSSPGELQAAIDSNRREGRRQNYGSAIFDYSPVSTPALLSSPKIQMSHRSVVTHNSGHIPQTPVIKKEEPMMASCLPSHIALPMSAAGYRTVAMVAPDIAAQSAEVAQATALEQLREQLESGEPPEKKMMTVAEEQQRIMKHTLQHNLMAMATQLPLNIKLNNRDDRQETALNLSTNGISSINMSIEINGVVYTGVLFARQSAIAVMTGQRGSRSKCQNQETTSPKQPRPSCSSSSSSSSSSLLGHRNSSP